MAAELADGFNRLTIAEDGLPAVLSQAVSAYRHNIHCAADGDMSLIVHALVLIHNALDDYADDESLCLAAFYWLRSVADHLQGAQPVCHREFTNPYDYDHVGMIDHLQEHTMMMWLRMLEGAPVDPTAFGREFTSAMESVL